MLLYEVPNTGRSLYVPGTYGTVHAFYWAISQRAPLDFKSKLSATSAAPPAPLRSLQTPHNERDHDPICLGFGSPPCSRF